MSRISNQSPEIIRRNLIKSTGAAFVGLTATNSIADIADAATEKGSAFAPYNSIRTIKDKLDDYVNVRDFGAVGDGITNDRIAIQSAINYAATNNLPLFFTKGVYGIMPDANGSTIHYQPNSEWYFQSAELKLLSDTGPIGGFVSSPYVDPPNDYSQIRTDNVSIHNIVVDCNNIPGENAMGCYGSGFRIYNPTIKNVKRDLTRLGGRAFQFEGSEIEDNHIFNPYLVNCSIGINAQASNSNPAKVSRAITYHNVTMSNVAIPVNMDNTNESTPNDVGDARFMSTFIVGIQCLNCGRPDWVGADPLEGAIITGDRGFGLRIDGLRVINEDTYGEINALVRGTLFNFQLNNASIETSSMEALFNLTNLSSPTWSAAGSSYQSTIYAKNIRCIRSSLDYVVKTKSGGGALGASIFEDIQIDNSVSVLTSAVDRNAAGYSNALLELVDSRQGTTANLRKTTGLVDLSSVNSIGLSDLLRDKKLISKTAWPVTDGSGASLTLISSDFFYTVKEGIVEAWVTIEFPLTADTRPIYLTGLPLPPIDLIGQFPIESTAYNARAVGNPSKAFEFFHDDGTAVLNNALSGRTIHIRATYRI